MKETVKTSRTAGYLEKIFRALNAKYFNGELEEPIITIQSTPRAYEHVTVAKALPAAYYKKLCRERLIPVQEPNQRSGWPLKFDCGRSDLPYIFRITLPAKNLSPFYPIRPEKYVDKPRFIWYIIQAIFCGHGPLVKRLRQRPLTPLTWVRFPHGSPKNTPAYAGVFFRVSRARNRTGQCAAAHKKQSSGLFFSPREIPACVTRTTPAYAGVVFRVSVRGIEPDGAQVLLCAIMERCVFGCILDMKIPPELSEFFLCLL